MKKKEEAEIETPTFDNYFGGLFLLGIDYSSCGMFSAVPTEYSGHLDNSRASIERGWKKAQNAELTDEVVKELKFYREQYSNLLKLAASSKKNGSRIPRLQEYAELIAQQLTRMNKLLENEDSKVD